MATPPILDYNATLTAARNAIEFYKTIWANDTTPNGTHIWQKSNQVDSYFNFAEQSTRAFGGAKYDFYNLVRDINVQTNPKSLLADLWNNVNQALARKDPWTDDYGWAGIACLQVANWVMGKPGANPVWQLWYHKAAECWQRMQLIANTLSKGGDPIPDGILNRPLVPNEKDEHAHFVKNTVTNTLYFVLSMRLYLFIRNTNNIPVDPHLGNIKKLTLLSAYAMYAWFQGWINQAPHGDTQPRTYWHVLKGEIKVAMLEERPVAYPPHKGVANPLPPDNTYDGYNPYDRSDGEDTAPPYSEQSSWTGDQGLFLHGCCLLYMWRQDIQTVLGQPPAVVAQIESDMLNWIPGIADGVLKALTQGYTDNVLRESPFDCFFNQDPEDYVCGRGVLARFFMRTETLQALQLMEYDIVSLYKPAWQATSYYCAVTNPNFNVANPANSLPGQLSAVWHAGASSLNPNYDKVANTAFSLLWGVNPDFHALYTWPPINKNTSDTWKNYCLMMGFDVFGAWIQANPFWAPQVTAPADKEKEGKLEN